MIGSSSLFGQQTTQQTSQLFNNQAQNKSPTFASQSTTPLFSLSNPQQSQNTQANQGISPLFKVQTNQESLSSIFKNVQNPQPQQQQSMLFNQTNPNPLQQMKVATNQQGNPFMQGCFPSFPASNVQSNLPFTNQSSGESIQELKNVIVQLQTRVEQLEKVVEAQNIDKQRVNALEQTVQIMARLCSANFKGLCNNGHALEYFNQADIIQNISCDVCKQNLQGMQIGSYRCKICDFDRCELCYNNCRLQ